MALAADRADVPGAQDGARQVRGRPHRQLVGAGLIISGGSNLGLFAGRILWMISMIPTEELIIDTIKNVLLFKKFAILILHRVIKLCPIGVLPGTFVGLQLLCLVSHYQEGLD